MSASAESQQSPGQPTTVGQWFQQLNPAPPAALAAELQRLLAAHADRPVADIPEACLEAGEELLQQLLKSGSTERATALTLLSVDSLVTYAFEAASYDAAKLEPRAALAMRRIAQLGEA